MANEKLGLEALEEISGGGAEIFDKFAGLSGAKQAAIIGALATITAGAAVGATLGAKPAYRAIRGYDPTKKFILGDAIDAEKFNEMDAEAKKDKIYAKDKNGKYHEMKAPGEGNTAMALNMDGWSSEGISFLSYPTKDKK